MLSVVAERRSYNMVKQQPNQRKRIARRAARDRMLLRGIKQGVGAINNSPFPKVRKNLKRSPMQRMMKTENWANSLNAMHPCHLPLPRAVGGYSVIRTTQILGTNEPALLIGAFKGPGNEFSETCWLDLCAVSNSGGGEGNPINGTGNAYFYGMSPLSRPSLDGSRMVPAAITVQIMNPQPLQTTTGIVYVGRSKTVLDLMGEPRTWNTLMADLVSYSAPRLCSAGKLALRGVQVNAIPNNLSVLSDFVPRRLAVPGVQTWTEANYSADFEGFGPIFVYNPNKVTLQYIVTIEWRMRFDPLNPAYAGHTVHAPASESTWSKVISCAEAVGNGVVDIAEVAADAGASAFGAALASAILA